MCGDLAPFIVESLNWRNGAELPPLMAHSDEGEMG
jgi:hypothetical protein